MSNLQIQSTNDNLNFIVFSTMAFSGWTMSYSIPTDKYSLYDLSMTAATSNKSHAYKVEVKGRIDKHYEDCMIDAYKIDKLRELADNGEQVRLVILEQFRNRIYIFNLNEIDWKQTRKETWNLPATTMAERQYNRLKEEYFIPWSEAKEFTFDKWVN